MSNREVDQLRELLEKERTALLAGDLGAVGALVAEKEELAKKLEDQHPSELRSLAAALQRNGTLLVAARQGVEGVVTTLREQRAARTTLCTYDSSGRPSQISRATKGTERRF